MVLYVFKLCCSAQSELLQAQILSLQVQHRVPTKSAGQNMPDKRRDPQLWTLKWIQPAEVGTGERLPATLVMDDISAASTFIRPWWIPAQ